VPAIVTYIRMSALHTVRLPPPANVPAQLTLCMDECIRCHERQQDDDAAFCQIILDTCIR